MEFSQLRPSGCVLHEVLHILTVVPLGPGVEKQSTADVLVHLFYRN
jgi:hypothetical protein